jgi:hypothetical protein
VKHRPSFVGALICLLIAAVAPAQGLLRGVGFSGSVLAYNPKLVTFGPGIVLQTLGGGPAATTAALTNTSDSGYGIHYVCMRGTTGIGTTVSNGGSWSVHNLDVIANWGPATNSSEGVQGETFTFDNAPGSNIGSLRANAGDASNTSSGTTGHKANASIYSVLNTGMPECYLWAYAYDGAGSTKHAIYKNGVAVLTAFTAGSSPATFNITNPKGWGINASASNVNHGSGVDIGDVLMDWHNQTDKTSTNWRTYLLANGTLPASTVSAFYDSATGPVDITNVPPLSATPELLFSGDKTAFVTNKGTVTNTFEIALYSKDTTYSGNTKQIWNASQGITGPQDAFPFSRWPALVQSVAGASTSTPTSFTIYNNALPVYSGDLMILVVVATDNGGQYVDRNIGVSTPTGWTRFGTATANANGYPMNTAAFWHRVDPVEATAARGTTTWTNAPTFGINVTGATQTMKQLGWHLMEFGQSAGGVIAASPKQITGAAGVFAITANGITPTSPTSLLVNAFCVPNPTASGNVNPPTSQDVRWTNMSNSGTVPYCLLSDEKITGTSALTGRTATEINAGTPSMAWTFSVSP